MGRLKPKKKIKLIEKQMIELEITTDGTRLCVLTLDQKALSYLSIIQNVLDKMCSAFSC